MLETLPKAILFDNDGVLVASEPLHWAAWGQLLQELGIPYVEAELRAAVGKTAPEILLELLNRYRPGWDPVRTNLVELAQRKNDFYLELAKVRLGAYPGVLDGLEWLRSRGIRIAVCSNAKRREVDAALTITGLRPLVDEVISRDDVPAPKPDPAMYVLAAASLGAEPGQCLVVEDSPPGLEAGLLGGIPAAAVLTNFPRSALEAPVPGRPDLKPAWIVKDMAELFERLRELAG